MEINTYLDAFGSIPTKSEIDQYLKANAETSHSEELVKDLAVDPEPLYTPSTSFYTFFKSGKWITRDGIVSLSLASRDGGIGNEGGPRTWGYVYITFNHHANWKKYPAHQVNPSMEKQYLCHFRYGMLKTPWNLEPHKKAENVSNITCN